MSKKLLLQLFVLKSATELHELAALALIQSAMGIDQNIDPPA